MTKDFASASNRLVLGQPRPTGVSGAGRPQQRRAQIRPRGHVRGIGIEAIQMSVVPHNESIAELAANTYCSQLQPLGRASRPPK